MAKIYNKGHCWPVVRVRWIDCSGQPGWVNIDDIKCPLAECTSVGHLKEVTTDSILIVPHVALYDTDNILGDGVFRIPRSTIVDVLELTVANSNYISDGGFDLNKYMG